MTVNFFRRAADRINDSGSVALGYVKLYALRVRGVEVKLK